MAIPIRLRVNGADRQHEVEPRLLFVHLIRDVFNLTGTHVGCETGICGACTVLIDGRRVLACLTLAAAVDGKQVTTGGVNSFGIFANSKHPQEAWEFVKWATSTGQEGFGKVSDIPADMTEEETKISLSTPGQQLPPKPAA